MLSEAIRKKRKFRVKVGISINAIQRDISLQMMSDISRFKGAEYVLLPSTEAHTIPGLLHLRVMQAKEEGCSHALFIDFDMEIPSYGPERLLSYGLPIVGGLYHLRRYPFSPVGGWLQKAENRTRLVNKNGDSYGAYYTRMGEGLVKVDWTGVGCLLVDMKVFSKLRKPFQAIQEGLGHDIAFCVQAKVAGYQTHVDTTVNCGHITPIAVDQIYAEVINESGVMDMYYKQLRLEGDGRFSHSMELASYEIAQEANK